MRNLLGRLRRPISRSQLTRATTLISDGDGSTLSLDFTAMSSLDSRFTFTRASTTSTFINSSGLVATAGTNVARFDHNPTTLAPRGLLIEGSATNLTLSSEALNQTSVTQWAGSNFNTPTVPAGAPNSPYGTTTASWKLVATSGAGLHMWRNYVTFTAAAYTFSFWAKAAEYDRIVLGDPGSGRGGCTFVLSGNGTATVITGTTTPTNPTIVPYPNGWYRCSVTMTMTAATYALGIAGYPSTGATVNEYGASYTADGTSGIYATMFQTELASGASSYIPTGASTVQRAADSCSIAASSSWLNTASGTFLVNWHRGDRGGTERSAFSSDYVAGRLLQLNNTDVSTSVSLIWWNGNIFRTTGTAINKAAYTYGQTTGSGATLQLPVRLCVNGSAVATGTFGNGTTNGADVPNPVNWTNFVIGAASASAPYTTASRDWLNNCVRSIKFWPTVLPDATLQSLTQ